MQNLRSVETLLEKVILKPRAFGASPSISRSGSRAAPASIGQYFSLSRTFALSCFALLRARRSQYIFLNEKPLKG